MSRNIDHIPVWIGDVIYRLVRDTVTAHEVKKIVLFGNERYSISTEVNTYFDWEFRRNWFLTKEEAEEYVRSIGKG